MASAGCLCRNRSRGSSSGAARHWERVRRDAPGGPRVRRMRSRLTARRFFPIVTCCVPSRADHHPEDFVHQHLRRNVLALGGDFALYMVGLAFASQSTILPAFAASLGAPNIVIGAIPAATTLGWLLPRSSWRATRRRSTRSFRSCCATPSGSGRPYLVLALSAFLLAERAPTLALGVLLLVLLGMTGVSGALLPGVDGGRRTRDPPHAPGTILRGVEHHRLPRRSCGELRDASILAAVRAPASYGVCFLRRPVCMALSYVVLAVHAGATGLRAAGRQRAAPRLSRRASPRSFAATGTWRGSSPREPSR